MKALHLNSRITLNNGTSMPVVGFGVFRIPDGEEAVQAVKWALQAGYRLIDTAKRYENEEGVGKALRESDIPREEIFVIAKLWNTDQGYENTLKAIHVSLAKLGLSYVDQYLIHWPTANESSKISLNKREETWKAMEEIYKAGLAKSIGVCNYTISHLKEMKGYATIPPTVNQAEFHPFLYQDELLNYCKENNIVFEAHSPLALGKSEDNAIIKSLAEKYGKTRTQVLIRWSLQHGAVPISKSAHKERIEENIKVFDFKLSEEDMKTLDGLNEDLHLRSDPNNLK